MPDPVLSGRYRLDAPLGRGGMATVWRAWDNRLDRPVAVKILDRAGLDDPAAAARFDREARTVARLAHPGVVSIYDVGAHDGSPFLVMELVEGGTVAQLVAQGPLPVAQAVSVAEQVCSALEAAHAAGIVHRDIKPANVMVTGDGRVKVCDFGIARHAYAAAQALTAPATAVGTSAYMAPEQATGGPVDARTDLYALGCVIYTMLTGGPPFAGERDISVLYQHIERTPAPIRAVRADVPAELDGLVGRMLAKNPADRPASARQVRDELTRSARHAATGAPAVAAPAERASGMRGTAAVVSPTRSFPVAYPDDHADGGYAATPRRTGRVAFALAALVIGAAIVVLLVANLLKNSGSGPSAATPPVNTPSSTSSTPASAPASTTPTPAASTPGPTPTTADEAIQQLRTVLQQLTQSGQIDPGAAQDLSGQIDDIAGVVDRNGHHHDVTGKIDDMRHKISDLADESKISPAGAAALNTALDLLAATVPGGGGDQGGKDNG